MPTDLDRILALLCGLVARRQLVALGIDADRVRDHVRAPRWVVVTPRVVATVTGPLNQEQRRWVAVLHAGPRSMLGGLSAAARTGLQGWDRDEVTLWVEGDLSFEPVDGARIEPAVLLWAAHDAPPRAAVGVLAASVQQRRTTAARLLEWIDRLRPLRRSPLFRSVLTDVTAGTAASAADPTATAPSAGPTARGTCPTGPWSCSRSTEPRHVEATTRTADERRAHRLAGPGRIQLSCTATELRTEPHEVAHDLIALGVPARRTYAAAQSFSTGA